ncbi:MAG TPA: hypothetical protein VN690_05610 [Terriglobales bacterium]|nr:hypothetical protein [Terriglobales bacterium]
MMGTRPPRMALLGLAVLGVAAAQVPTGPPHATSAVPYGISPSAVDTPKDLPFAVVLIRPPCPSNAASSSPPPT